ncbi:MAG: YcxB family protein [Clostridia bacterium]|nr:YcxB family protein [Clostridia bacterium]
MHYRINVNLTEEDYFQFNKFVQFYAPAGKKNFTTARIIISLLPVMIAFLAGIHSGFNTELLAGIILMIPVSVLVFFTFKPFIWFTTKLQIKAMMKKGALYSPVSCVEFYDDHLVDYTPQKQVQINYSSFSSAYVVNSGIVYLFENAVNGVIVPISSFSSAEEWNSFINFISSKTGNVTAVRMK